MRYVVAADGSELSIEAARRAREIVAPDAEAVLVYAVPEAPDDTGAGGIEGPDISPEELDRLVEEERAEAETALTATAAELGLVGARHEVVIGSPGPALCRIAEELGAGLVVVGSHGRGGITRTLLGSVSDYVVRHAPCPVLVCRHQQR